MSTPKPGDLHYDAARHGMPVVILDGANDLGSKIDALATDIAAHTVADSSLKSSVEDLKASVDLLITAVNALAEATLQ
jgi:outer membrane murein-binding lipoprotein Lpp